MLKEKQKKVNKEYKSGKDKLRIIEDLKKWYTKIADKERSRLEKLKKEVDEQTKDVIAERKGFIIQKEALEKRESRVRDKERTLKKVFEEVKAKAKKVNIMI